jgi:DNA-binding LytR/AlgR family response regulator
MRLRLVCDPSRRAIVGELLAARDLGPDDEADISLVELGFEKGEAAALVFDPSRLEALLPVLDSQARCRSEAPSTIALRREERIELVPLKSILYFETEGPSVQGFTASASGELRVRLYELEERLPPGRFARVSKSAIVNLGAVREVHPWFGRCLLLRFGMEGRQVEVSRNYVRNLKERLGI